MRFPMQRLLFIALLAACGAVFGETAAQAPGPAPAIAGLVDTLDRIRRENGVAAFGLALVDGEGVVHLEARGLADRADGRPIGSDPLFRIGSISKMFTALAALQLAAGSDFDIDLPIARWPMAAYYDNPWRETRPLTTAMLLEHTAGLSDLAQAEWDYSDPRQLPLDETLRLYPRSRRLRWPPGIHASYSNAGAGLAGRVMELASGRSYEQLIGELVFGPLGLRDSSVLPPVRGLALGYDRDGTTPIPYWHPIFRPFGAINSSLADMGRFTVMLINRGRLGGEAVFSPELIERLEMPRTTLAARSGLRYGYGLGNYSWLRRGILFRGHGGDADGYLAKLGYTRANDSGYFLVITAFQGRTLRAMQRQVELFLISGVEAQAAPPSIPLTAQQLAQRVGQYAQATQRFPGGKSTTMEISVKEGALLTRLAGRKPKRLIPLTERLYRRDSDNRATVFLGPGPDGAMVYQDDARNFVRRAQ